MGTPLHLDGDVRALRPPGQSGLVVVGLLGLVRDQGRHDRQMTGTNAPEVQIGYAIITFLNMVSALLVPSPGRASLTPVKVETRLHG